MNEAEANHTPGRHPGPTGGDTPPPPSGHAASDWWVRIYGSDLTAEGVVDRVLADARGSAARGGGHASAWAREVWQAFGEAGVTDGADGASYPPSSVVLVLAGLVRRLAGEVAQLRAEAAQLRADVTALRTWVGSLDARTVGGIRMGPPGPLPTLAALHAAGDQVRVAMTAAGLKPLTSADVQAIRESAAGATGEAAKPIQPHPTGGLGE